MENSQATRATRVKNKSNTFRPFNGNRQYQTRNRGNNEKFSAFLCAIRFSLAREITQTKTKTDQTKMILIAIFPKQTTHTHFVWIRAHVCVGVFGIGVRFTMILWGQHLKSIFSKMNAFHRFSPLKIFRVRLEATNETTAKTSAAHTNGNVNFVECAEERKGEVEWTNNCIAIEPERRQMERESNKSLKNFKISNVYELNIFSLQQSKFEGAFLSPFM